MLYNIGKLTVGFNDIFVSVVVFHNSCYTMASVVTR